MLLPERDGVRPARGSHASSRSLTFTPIPHFLWFDADAQPRPQGTRDASRAGNDGERRSPVRPGAEVRSILKDRLRLMDGGEMPVANLTTSADLPDDAF